MDHYRWQKRSTPGQDANVNPQQQQPPNQPPPPQSLPPPPTSTTLRSSNPNPLPTTAAPSFLSQPLMPSQGFPPSYPRPSFHPLATASHSAPIVRDTLVPPPPHPSHHPHHSFSTVQQPPPLHVRLPQLSQLQSQPRISHLSHPHPTQIQQQPPPPPQPNQSQQQQNNQQPSSLSIHSSRRLSSSPLHQSSDPRSQQLNRSDAQSINLPSASRLPHLQSQPNPITTSAQQQSQTSSQQQQIVQKQAGQKSPPQSSSQQPNNPSQQQQSSSQPPQQQQNTQTTNNTSAVVQTSSQSHDPNQQSSSAQQNQQHAQSQQLPSHSQPSPQHQQQHLSLPHPTHQPTQQNIQQNSQPHQIQRQSSQPSPYHQPHEQDPRMAQHSHRDMKRSIYEPQQPPYRLSQPQQPSYYHPYSTPHPHPHQPQMSTQHPQMYQMPPPPPHEYQQHNVPHETHDPQMQQQHQRLAPNHSMIPQHPQHAPPHPHHHQQPQPQQQPQQMVHHAQQPQPQPPPQQMNPQQRPQQQSSQPQPPQQAAQQQQQRQSHKMINSLQPQPISMVQMRPPQNQQQANPHLQQQQQIANPEHHHHLQKQQMQAVSSQQPIHMGHHQQPQQPLSTGSNRLQPIQERRPSSTEIHQPPTAQMHMPPPPSAVMSTMPLQQRPPMPIRQLPQQPPVAKQQPQQQPLPQNQQHMHSQQSHQPTHTQVIPVEQSRHQHPVQQAQPQTQENMSRSQPIQPMQNMQIDTSNTNAAQSSTTMNQEGNAHQQQQGGAFRQLRVEDALAYLEQVKSRFSESPTVYNNFLDIMKEFKAQTIDTSEVIRRVSSLFQGHRELILGFNTFLPPGYRIELRGDPVAGGVTGFSTPGGVFCPLRDANPPQMIQQSQGEMNIPPGQQQPVPVETVTPHPSSVQNSQPPRHQIHHGQPEIMHQPIQQAEVSYEHNGYVKQPIESEEKPAMLMNMNQGQHQMSVTTPPQPAQPVQPVQPVQPTQPAAAVSPSPQNDNAAAALAGGFGSSACNTTVATGKPIEFDQAVTYVNKIKSRFSEDEHGYKTFLDILQTYQREQRSIKDVYKQVSVLFQDHPDLLQEFSHFLPEQVPKTANPQPCKRKDSEGGGSGRSKPATQVKQQPVLETTPQDTSSTPSTVNKPRDKNSKGGVNKKVQRSGQSSLGPSGGVTKTTNSNQRKNLNSKDKTSKKSSQSGKRNGTDSKSSPVLQSVTTPSTIAVDAPGPELEFFEELRILLGEDGKQNYSEFIKCLSLFSAEIICLDELLRLADGLLNHRKPLTDAFRAFLDQTDPNATQSAVNILKKNKSSNGVANQSRNQPIQRNLDSPSARERLRDIPAMVGLEASRSGGNKSPRANPLYKNKPLSEIGRDYGSDLPDSKTYKAVPADLGTIQCSGMTENDRSVLNHLCVSKGNSTGKRLIDDDSSNKNDAQRSTPAKISNGKSSIMNETGENWEYDSRGISGITIEDQRVELDLLIARAQSCIEKLERLEKGETKSASSLNQVDLKPIELIYKEASVNMIDALKSNPSGTVPIILERLRQRLKDWEGSRSNMAKIWKSNQFCSANQEECAPRSWHKSEMISELILLRKEKEIPSSLNWLQSRKKISGNDIRGTIVCEDDNLSIICDILWYVFEWAAQNAEEADEGLAFLERVYSVMQRSEQKKMSILADDYLYCYIRLLAEASERIEYLVREDKVEMCTDETIQKIKDILGNFVTLEKYDDHCKKVYKNVNEWEIMLGELPLILKRLGELAFKMPKRAVAAELLSQAEKGVRSESNVETSHEDDTMTDVDEGKNGDGSSEDLDGDDVKAKYSKRLRQAILLTRDHDCHLFEIKIHEDTKDEEKNGKRKRCLDVSFRFIPREIAYQFRKLNLNDEENDHKKDDIKGKRKRDLEDTSFTKYVRRAKKRSRSYFHGRTGESIERDILRADGLRTQVDDSNGRLIFTVGTEDFFMRKGFGRMKRKIKQLAFAK